MLIFLLLLFWGEEVIENMPSGMAWDGIDLCFQLSKGDLIIMIQPIFDSSHMLPILFSDITFKLRIV